MAWVGLDGWACRGWIAWFSLVAGSEDGMKIIQYELEWISYGH